MTEKIGYLLYRQGFYCSVGLFHTVYKVSCEGMAERVQSFTNYSITFEKSVVFSSEYVGFGIVAILVAD